MIATTTMSVTRPLPVIGIPANVREVGVHPFHAVGEKYVNAIAHGAWLRPGDDPTSLRAAPWREEPPAQVISEPARATARTLDRTAATLGV